jgi:hypothetical protein
MSVAGERDLLEQLGGALDGITPPEPPVGAAVRKGKIIQAGRSLGIVTGLAVLAGLGMGTPGLLHQSAAQAMSPVTPTVLVDHACPGAPGGTAERAGRAGLAAIRVGEIPGTQGRARPCAWLEP